MQYMDETTKREVPYLNNTAVIHRDGNPYGFFVIKLTNGITPKELHGYFTNMDEAERAVKTHETLKKERK